MSRREIIAMVFGLLNTTSQTWTPIQDAFVRALAGVREWA